MVAAEKANTSLLLGTIGFSLLVHVAIAISIMNIEIPKVSSRADFEAWVKDIAPPRRQAIILPEVPKKLIPKETAKAEEPVVAEAAEAPAGKATKATKTAKTGGAAPTRTKTLKASGILGVIGVASDNSSGKKSAMADVFSSQAGKVSDDLGAVMEGKQRVELANSANISRQALKSAGGVGGVGGGSGKPADIGGIATASTGKVAAVQRQESGVPAPRVNAAGAGVVSGSADQASVLGVIARKNSSFTRCYERALRNNPELAGKLGYELSVTEEGQVLDVRFIEDTLRTRDVTDCIKSILSRLVFPKPKGGPAIFSSVLIFGTT